MTTRKQHLAEMQYALANNCSLQQARAALAQLRQRAADELLQELESRPVRAGRSRSYSDLSLMNDARWMMRD